MAGTNNGRVWFACSTRNFADELLFGPGGDRVCIAECAQEWSLEFAQDTPRDFVVFVGWVVDGDWDESWEDSCSALKCFVGEWRVVRRDFLRAQRAQASHIHNFPYFKHGCCL